MLDFWGSRIEVTSFITKELIYYTLKTKKIGVWVANRIINNILLYFWG